MCRLSHGILHALVADDYLHAISHAPGYCHAYLSGSGRYHYVHHVLNIEVCLPIMFLTFVDNQKDNMEKTLLNIETVTEYDDMLGVETLHP